MDEKNFIYSKSPNGKYTSGGYIINSQLLNKYPLNKVQKGGKSTKGSKKNEPTRVVPAGLFLLKRALDSNTFDKLIESQHDTETNDPDVISEDLYDKLLNLVEPRNNVDLTNKKKSTKSAHNTNTQNTQNNKPRKYTRRRNRKRKRKKTQKKQTRKKK